MAFDKAQILSDLEAVPKDWYSIYQWKPTARIGYTEWISEWLDEFLDEIRLIEKGLRQRSFKFADHRGQISLQTGIEQLTEKRLVRAMFNLVQVPALGKVVDYEVPLKESDDAKHGDIDLLCISSESALCVEAKKPEASESLLKAILQAFVYTSLVATRREAFLKDFDLPPILKLTPSVLTFASAQSARQIRERDRYPNLWRLASTLNLKLEEKGIAPFRFFIVENTNTELKTCLMTSAQANKDVKVMFTKGFVLNVVEYPFTAGTKR